MRIQQEVGRKKNDDKTEDTSYLLQTETGRFLELPPELADFWAANLEDFRNKFLYIDVIITLKMYKFDYL